MKQLTEASGNSLEGGILSSAICSVGLFNCLQYMSVHTTQRFKTTSCWQPNLHASLLLSGD